MTRYGSSTQPVRSGSQWGGGGSRSPGVPSGPQVVGDDELAEVVGVGEQHPAAGAAGDGVHEPAQPRVLPEHEEVDAGAEPGEVVELGDGGLDGLRFGWPAEQGVPVGVEVGGGFAVGDDHEDGVAVPEPAQMPAGQGEGVGEVGALLVVGFDGGQLALGQGGGVPAEADDLQRVLRVLGGDKKPANPRKDYPP